MAVDDAAVSNAHDTDDYALLVNGIDDAVVTGLRPVQMVRADDAADARPARIGRKALEHAADGHARGERQALKSTLGRDGEVDFVGQACTLQAQLGLDLAPGPRLVEFAGFKSALVLRGVVLVFHELGNEHVLDRDDRREVLAVTLDHEAVAAVGTAADDLGQLLPELTRSHGVGVSEVVVGDAVFEVVGHDVISGRFVYTYESLSTWYTTAPRAASPWT